MSRIRDLAQRSEDVIPATLILDCSAHGGRDEPAASPGSHAPVNLRDEALVQVNVYTHAHTLAHSSRRASLVPRLGRMGSPPYAARVATALVLRRHRAQERVHERVETHVGEQRIGLARHGGRRPTAGAAGRLPQTAEEASQVAAGHWGNCAWDALGVPAALHGDARITTHCGDCAEPLEVQVERGRPHGEVIEHLGVPARDFWKNVVFT